MSWEARATFAGWYKAAWNRRATQRERAAQTTGKLKWYYQFTPGDTDDWDANEDLILADRVIDGNTRKLIMQADLNGMFYILDRTNGKLIFAKP